MDTKPRLLTILDIVSGGLFAIAVGMVFFYAPMEATMGEVQRVFYFHVASAWVGSLGFAVALVAGILYLVKSDRKWDIVEVAAIEISLVFFFIAIASGYVWSALAWHMTDSGPGTPPGNCRRRRAGLPLICFYVRELKTPSGGLASEPSTPFSDSSASPSPSSPSA